MNRGILVSIRVLLLLDSAIQSQCSKYGMLKLSGHLLFRR